MSDHKTIIKATFHRPLFSYEGKKNCSIRAFAEVSGFESNGHFDLCITGEIRTSDRRYSDPILTCGCIHEEIAKYFPNLRKFIPLHLSATNGEPMYPLANGLYHLANSSKEVAMSFLRISEDEYNLLLATFRAYFKYEPLWKYYSYDKKSDAEEIFRQQLLRMGIPRRWKKEADEFIHFIESECGMEFHDPIKEHRLIFPA